MKQKIKKVAVFIVVIIVIVFMAASYLISGFDIAATPEPTGFQGPTSEPFVNGPTEPPPGTQ